MVWTHRLRWNVLILAGLSGLALFGCSGDTSAPPSATDPLVLDPTQVAGRSILVVLSDTHRQDHVSAGPSKTPGHSMTPHLAWLARDGVTLTDTTTPVPVSAPAYASLFTGLLPAGHGVLNNHQSLGTEPPVLAETLRAAGYQTAAAVSNPFCSSAHGFDRGFDSFWDLVEGHGKGGDRVTEAALDWLDQRDATRPFFLFLAYMDAHTPYVTAESPASLMASVDGEPCCLLVAENSHREQRIPFTAEGRTRLTLRALASDPGSHPHASGQSVADPPTAGSELYVTDLHVYPETLELRRLDGFETVSEGRYERLANTATVEVVPAAGTAGPVEAELRFRAYRRYRPEETPDLYATGVRHFDRHFGQLLAGLGARGLYDDTIILFVSDHGEMLGEHGAWGHVDALWHESLRVPAILKAPGLEPGSDWDGPVDLTDLHGLLTGLADPSSAAPPTLVGQGPRLAATYPPEAQVLRLAAQEGDYKLVGTAEALTSDGADLELYDLSSDPAEQHNLFAERRREPEVRRLVDALRQHLADLSGAQSLDRDALDADALKALEALGYLGH